MKKIALERVHGLLAECRAAAIGDNALARPDLRSLTGNPENIFLELRWTDCDDITRSLKFREGENREVKASGSSVFLTERGGGETEVSLLKPWDLE